MLGTYIGIGESALIYGLAISGRVDDEVPIDIGCCRSLLSLEISTDSLMLTRNRADI